VHFAVNVATKDVEKAEQQGLTEFFKLTSKVNTGNMICFDFDSKIKKYNTTRRRSFAQTTCMCRDCY
jgi:DNA topoisomerase-2